MGMLASTERTSNTKDYNMFLAKRYLPGLAIYTYLVGDDNIGECAVVDPTRDVEGILRLAEENDLNITHILETHVHADFASGARELKARLNDKPQICASGLGGDEWTPAYADRVIQDGEEVSIGQTRLQATHTPGHTHEHITWAVYDESRSSTTPWLLLTGDFLFVGDVGRPDLLGEEAQQELARELYESVFSRLERFPDYVEVFPSHGAGSLCGKAMGSRSSTTLGYERKFNPAFQNAPLDEWVDVLLSGMPIAPNYFRKMKELNQKGPQILGRELPGQTAISPADAHRGKCENCLFLDVRPKEAFAGAHVPNSINIPLGDNLPTWAGWVLPYDSPLMIVANDAGEVRDAATHLIRIGLDDICGYLDGGIRDWEQQGYPIQTLDTMSVHDLHERHKGPGELTVLDVRTQEEWDDGHIDGAIHIHGGQLQQRMEEVPRDKPVAVVCGSGYRASIAASFLQRAGYDDVTNIPGGMKAWTCSSLPTT